jgi:hypothetical protein
MYDNTMSASNVVQVRLQGERQIGRAFEFTVR